jgi:hypothetical protein
MPSPQFVAGALIAVGIVLVVLAVVQATVCGGGYSLLYVGIASILIGAGVALLGGVFVAIPAGIIGIILMVIGYLYATGAGCTL